jgi:hypothetical protein
MQGTINTILYIINYTYKYNKLLLQLSVFLFFSIVVDLEKMNGALQDFLNDIQELCQEIAPEPSVVAMLAPSHLREKCKQEAADMVARNNMVNDKEPGKMNQLVTDLTALMLQVKV